MNFRKWSKYFIFFFLLSFLLINWNEVSWIFNYRAVSGIIAGVFQGETSEGKIAERKAAGAGKAPEEGASVFPYSFTERENSLEIPKLEISVPLIFPEKESEVQALLNRGVVHYPGSALPGVKGQTIILGHSAPLGWPKIRYDWVFTSLAQLDKGDEIFVYFDHKKYAYKVKGKLFLDRGESLSYPLTNSENMLILISCWPPGKDFRRIAVKAEIK